MADQQTAPGWYPDAQTPGQQRYWDGSRWTENVAPLAPPPVVQTKKGHGCLYAFLIVAAVVVLGVAGLIVLIGTGAKKVSNEISRSNSQAMQEVKITSCRPDALGDMSIRGTADNTTSGRSNFLISVVVDSSTGTQLGSSTGFANDVEPGQIANWQAVTTASSQAGATCKVVSVLRTASLNP